MARFSTRSLRRPTSGRAARGCVRGTVWDDLRLTPAAEALETRVPREVFENFIAEHWAKLPRRLAHGRSHQSTLHQGDAPYLCIFTFCDNGRVQGLLCTPAEARQFAS